jgi:hypothetical protein
MQAAEESHQRALAAERAASAALVQAEEELQRLVRAHRPGSPTVDDAVTELADRRDEYDEACEASVRANTSCHNEHDDVIMNDRHLRWADHEERLQAARHPTSAVCLQQGSSAANAPSTRDADGDQVGNQDSPRDEKAAEQWFSDEEMTAEQWLDEEKATEQWISDVENATEQQVRDDDLPSASGSDGDQAETQGSQGDEANAAGDQGMGQATAGDDSSSASDAADDQSIQPAQSPPSSEYTPSDLESSASE